MPEKYKSLRVSDPAYVIFEAHLYYYNKNRGSKKKLTLVALLDQLAARLMQKLPDDYKPKI